LKEKTSTGASACLGGGLLARAACLRTFWNHAQPSEKPVDTLLASAYDLISFVE
jgi:hypothetical protein